jgi:tetratricopeptide (TPR) repeat protein
MINQQKLSVDFSNLESKIILLEAKPGHSRQQILTDLLQKAKLSGSRAWLLNCNHDEHGIWAGVSNLFNEIISLVQINNPGFLIKYDYELIHVLPALRKSISTRNPCLTDTAVGEEKVRNYPADRAYRIVNGLIDLFLEYYQDDANTPLIIICDEFDSAGFFVNRFFFDLMRRSADKLNLTLLLVGNHGSVHSFGNQLDFIHFEYIQLHLLGDIDKVKCLDKIAESAQKLECSIGKNRLETEINLPQLIHYWSNSDQPEKAVFYQFLACSIYTHQGFYEEGLVYGEAVLKQVKYLEPTYLWILYSRLYFCYASLGKPFESFEIMKLAIDKFEDAETLSQICYFMSMLHARVLPEKDLELAEKYLEQSNEYILLINLPDHEKYFRVAFNQNGLALIRHRQGKPQEAIEICKSCVEQLNNHLDPTKHHLHRSVLLFNIAQVYMNYDEPGSPEKAIAYLSEAMEMDPNYSEYYNDRGNIYLKLDRLPEALQDYQKAIDLSPPYWEVWSNVGQCHLRMNQLDKAIEALDRALDLHPNEFSVWVARAELFERLGMFQKALPDYDMAISLKSDDSFVWANRATLHYEMGNFAASLQDLNQAINISSDNADLYQNRAVALMSLGHTSEAIMDLQTYLSLKPDAIDQADVSKQVAALQKNI